MDRIYCGPAPDPAELLSRWNLDPVLLAVLSVFAACLWVLRFEEPVARVRAGTLGLAVLAVAFISPLCALSSALFSARVVHHVLLVLVAAPLLSATFRARRGGSLGLPLAVSSAVLWVWHAPAAYDLALSHVGVYWVMQVSLLGSFLWFWRAVRAPGRSPVEAATAIVASFAQMGLLGAILTFAPTQLYAAHALGPLAWGLEPLADQQLGGLIMWVPAGLPYAVLLWMVGRDGWARMEGRAA